MTFDEAPDLLKVGEVQELTRWSRNAIYEGIREGRIPAVHLGRAVRVPKWRLISFLENGDVASTSGDPSATTA